MKKLLFVFIVLFLLCGCSNTNEENKESVDTSKLSIVTPTGAPVLAFYNQIENENYSRVSADAISALWAGDNSPDVIVVDVASGVSAISNGAEYKLSAIITFGNFYLASTGNDEDDVMDAQDKIVLFGNSNMLPNKIFHYLYGNDFDENLMYEANAQLAAGALASGMASDGSKVDYVFLAQPALFGAMKKNENASIYKDIQEEYHNRSGLKMIQAAVFINNRIDQETGERFLDELKESIDAAIEDPEKVKEGLSVYQDEEAVNQYGFNPAVAVNVLKMKNASGTNAIGLGFEKALDIKNDIDAFLAVLGINKTDEAIYLH